MVYESIALHCPFAGSLAGFGSQQSQVSGKGVEVFANHDTSEQQESSHGFVWQRLNLW